MHLGRAQHNTARLTPQKNVGGGRQLGHERELLVDHVDAALSRRQRMTQPQRRSSQAHVARVGHDAASEYLHERRLAGAVLTDERMDFAGAHVEVHGVERANARIRFRQPGGREQRLVSQRAARSRARDTVC